jgi:hypothetical protein
LDLRKIKRDHFVKYCMLVSYEYGYFLLSEFVQDKPLYLQKRRKRRKRRREGGREERYSKCQSPFISQSINLSPRSANKKSVF